MYKKELEFFKSNQDELVEIFGGMVLAIKGEEVLGAYHKVLDAFLETTKTHNPGTFMLISCEPRSKAPVLKSNVIELVLA